MKIAFVVLYLVVTIAMISFIMLQRGSGANAGSGFGAGASGTVFGARGSANFLSKATKWLAVAFFALSLGMAVYETRVGVVKDTNADLGVMGQLPAPATGTAPAATEVPAAATEVPAAPATGSEAAVPGADASAASTSAEAAPAAAPAEAAPAPAAPAESGK